jgi:HPt (histidine-containing phosphotransfer) domain-containing protein
LHAHDLIRDEPDSLGLEWPGAGRDPGIDVVSAMGEPGFYWVTTFDWHALLDKLGGDEAFVHGLLAVALRSNAAMPAELRAAADLGDCDRMMHLAHKVKGTAGDLCAGALRAQAAAAESAAREGSDTASTLNRELANAVETLLGDLRRIAATLD